MWEVDSWIKKRKEKEIIFIALAGDYTKARPRPRPRAQERDMKRGKFCKITIILIIFYFQNMILSFETVFSL